MKNAIKINYKHYFCIAITLGFLLCSAFLFRPSFVRLITSFKDFGLSIAYYFCDMFGIKHVIIPTVNIVPDNGFVSFLPFTFGEFKVKFALFGKLLIDPKNLLSYFSGFTNLIVPLTTILLIFVPLLIILVMLFRKSLAKENNDYNKNSKPLRVYKRLVSFIYKYPIRFISSLVAFIQGHKAYKSLWLCLWLFNFNIFTIGLEFFAFYFYFMASFDVFNIYTQVYKLFMDLSVPLRFIPIWIWVILGLYLFDRFRKNIALMTLRHYEMCNRGFINSLPIVSMIVGTMGKKKTTTLTDMALSQEVMLRDKAFEKLLENDLKFPNFPWITLENAIKQAVSNHSVYNLATCKQFISSKVKRLERLIQKSNKIKQNNYAKLKHLCFDYDFLRYGLTYDDKLKLTSLFEVLTTYTQLYFIYIIQSSLLVSNYSVRSDNLLQDLGNFPMWNTDFFSRDSRLIDSFSRHAHILDFDCLRLGRKVIDNNVKSNALEFGCILITEGGKERGNMLDTKEMKKSSAETNQKNDGFNSWLKMVRHAATVDNFPFVKVIMDEQRPESMGADVRELCDIVHICETYDTKLAMPFFFLEELLYSLVFSKFVGFYYDYRFARADNTLFMYLIKGITSKLHNYYKRTYNNYAYMPIALQTENGTLDGKLKESKYYLALKKIYAKRFSTDCLSEFFTDKAITSPIGINDLEEYSTERASFAELQKQNSYFISDLMNKKNIYKD